MNMFEEARALWGTIKMCGISQVELAKKLGVSQSFVANKLRLLKYSPYMQDIIIESGLTERHARAILRLPDESAQRLAIARVRADKLTVAECEEVVDSLLARLPQAPASEAQCEAKIETLKAVLDSTLLSLTSAGIRATKHTEEDGEKIYITLSICRPERATPCGAGKSGGLAGAR